MADFTLRRAKHADAQDVADCLDAAYAIYSERFDDLPAVSEGIRDTIQQHRVWLAETQSQVVGVLVLVAQDNCLLLENIAVRPERAGQGLGRALIAQAEQDCLDLDLREIQLRTHERMTENIAIYSRLGWQETGRSGNKVHMSKRIERTGCGS